MTEIYYHPKSIFLFWLCLFGIIAMSFISGCKKQTTATAAVLNSPAGLTMAGTVAKRLFVANAGNDSVQVLNMSESLKQMDFISSPAQSFALSIPAGGYPGKLASLMAGRYVAVLDHIEEVIRIIDADTLLLVRNSNNQVVKIPIGNGQSFPADMLAAQLPTTAAGELSLLIALSGAGSILSLRVWQNESGIHLEPERLYTVGGQPAAIAIDGAGQWLFFTDPAQSMLQRLDLVSGLVEQLDIGGIGGPLAVLADGSMAVVGRPIFNDLVIIGEANQPTWRILDANPRYTPLPACLPENCEPATLDLCSVAHPADQALCVSDASGLTEVSDHNYPALYLGSAPVQMVTLGQTEGMAELSVPCTADNNIVPQVYQEFVLVATLDGYVHFITLKQSGTEQPEDALDVMSLSWCEQPKITTYRQAPDDKDLIEIPLADVLGPCPMIPLGRNRFTCVDDGQGNGGVVISPVNTQAVAWDFVWEGVAEGLDRVTGDSALGHTTCPIANEQGIFAQCGTFFDDTLNYINYDIRPCQTLTGTACPPGIAPEQTSYVGDTIEIRAPALGSCTIEPCAQMSTTTNWRVIEQRILAVESLGSSARLVVDGPWDDLKACLRSGTTLEYRIRSHGLFLAKRNNMEIDRIKPNQTLGPGGEVGKNQSVLLHLSASAGQESLTLCQRYDADGNRKADFYFRVFIDDPNSIFVSGVGFDSDGNISGSAGRMPSAMIAAGWDNTKPAVFLTYSGSNNILGFSPFALSNPFSSSNYRIVR